MIANPLVMHLKGNYKCWNNIKQVCFLQGWLIATFSLKRDLKHFYSTSPYGNVGMGKQGWTLRIFTEQMDWDHQTRADRCWQTAEAMMTLKIWQHALEQGGKECHLSGCVGGKRVIESQVTNAHCGDRKSIKLGVFNQANHVVIKIQLL